MANYLARLNAVPTTTSINTFVGTFIPTGSLSQIRLAQLEDSVALHNAREASFVNGVNVNFVKTLKEMTERAPQLVTCTAGLIQSADAAVPVIQTGPLPIEASKTITVIPPMTNQSGTFVYTVGQTEGPVFVPETVEIFEFTKTYNEFITNIFLIEDLITKMSDGEDDAVKDILDVVGALKLNNNWIWNRLMAAVQSNMPGMFNDSEAAKEVVDMVERYWLPFITSDVNMQQDVELIQSIAATSEAVSKIDFKTLAGKYKNSNPDKATLLKHTTTMMELVDKIKRLSDQLKTFQPYPIGTVVEAPSNLVYTGQEFVVALTRA